MSDTETEVPEQFQDTGEMLRLRVVNPPNAKFTATGEMVGGHIYNGYIGQRVYLGQETDIPLYRPYRDEDGNHLMNPDGTLRYKKQGVPRWGELVAIVPAPKGWEPPVAPVKKATAAAPLVKSVKGARPNGSTKTFGRNRAADTSITG
jgi:hypothetical protein